jgi:DNA-binding XRE family transcriptional regulator
VARQLYDAQDLTVEEIAKTIGLSRKTVHGHLSGRTEDDAFTPLPVTPVS